MSRGFVVSLSVRRLVLAAAVGPLFALPALAAQTWTGATNATWQTTTNWNLTTPGTTETAIFDASSTQNLGITLSSAVTSKGLRVTSPAGPLSIAGSTLSLGTGGIDMSAATRSLTLSNSVAILTGNQSWSVADGQAISAAAVPIRNNGANNNNVGGILVAGTTGLIRMGTAALGVVADFGGNPFVTYGINNWAATDASGNLVPATYTTDAFTAGTNVSIDTAGTYAIGTNALSFNSVRFNNVGGAVSVNLTSGHTQTFRGILMTSDAQAVTINGGNVRPNRTSATGGTGGASFSIINQSTTADLTINSAIPNASSSTPVAVVKSGAGKLVLGGGNGYTGRTFVNEGVLQIGNGATGGSISSTADIVVQAGATVAVNRSDAVTLSNPISGAGLFTQLGSGSTTLSGSNTFTGAANLNGGSLVFATAANLGSGTAITFNSGTLTYAGGNSADVSGRVMTFDAAGAAVNTNGNNVTYANAVGNAGTGGFTKAGSGRLTLVAGGNYTGNTTISTGELRVNGPLSSPLMTVASGATLSGTGSLTGAVTLDNGATLAPGNAAAGSVTLGSLTTSGGSSLIWEFNATPANDLVVVSTSDGLTINGGTFTFYAEGTANPFGTVGTYNLIQYAGAVQGSGVGSLAVANPAAGKSYTFGESGGYVTLTIATSGLVAQWNVDSSGDWATASNWTPSEPNGAGDTATFGAIITAPRTVTLNADRTIGNMVFSNSNSYTLAPAAAQSLTIGDGLASRTIQVEAGSHAITGPVVLASNVSTDVLSGQQLTLSGTVSGAGSLTKTSAGTLRLTGSNTYTGDTVVTGGAIEFTAGAISSGVVTLGGGGVKYASGNAEDLSVKTVNLAAGGGTIDTNGSDVTFANSIGNYGAGGLTKSGSGTLTLSAANTYYGATQINAGVLSVAADAALGGDPVAGLVLNGGTLRSTTGFTSARPLTSSAASTIDVPGEAEKLTLTGIATGAGLITKTGSGTLQLDGANTALAGGVTLAGGTVTLGGGVANGFQGIGTGTIAFQNGSVLNLNGYANNAGATSSGTLANPVVVAAGQSGTMNLPGRCTISAPVTGSGTLGVNVAYVRDDFTGNWSAFGGSVIVGLSGTNTYGDFRIGGTQTTFGNARVTLLSGVNMYQTFNPPSGTGTETVQPIGELSGDGTLAGNPVAGRFVNWTVGGLGTSSTFAGRITDSGTTGAAKLTKTGSGTLTLTGTSTFTGSTTVNGGTLYMATPNGDTGGLATTASITINNGGTLRSSANALFGWNANQGKDITVNTGGTLTADDGADVHVGRVTLNGGVLASTGSSVDFGSWVFDGPATILAVTETSTASAVNVRIQNGGSIDVAATKTLNFVGTITDSGSAGASNLIKTGTGTLLLAGRNTYTGPTTVSAGTLMVNGAITGAGTVGIAAGAILAGTGTVAGDTTIETGATIAPGTSPGTLSFGGSLTWNEGGNYNWQMLSGTGTAGSLASWDLVNVTGTLAIAATSTSPFQLNLWTLSGITPDVSGSAANFSPTQSYTWKIASAAGGITGFATDKFVINTSATNGSGGFANSFTGGTFSLAQSGNDLNLVFTGAAPSVITIDVASGTQTQTQAGYPTLSGSTPVVKTGGGTLVLDQANTLTGSTMVQGGVVQLANASALSTSRLVVVAGGTGQLAPFTTTAVAGLDLATGNGLMDVTNGSLTILGGMTAPELVAELLEGRADGSWTGTSGITSSTAAADIASSQPRAVGWLDNGDGTFTVAYAAPGDTNIDWAIDILDASNFLALGKFDTGLPATWIEGDFSYDGIVDILDAADFFATGLYDAGTYNAAPGVAGVAAVPEPAGVAWVGCGLCGLAAAWRRRRG